MSLLKIMIITLILITSSSSASQTTIVSGRSVISSFSSPSSSAQLSLGVPRPRDTSIHHHHNHQHHRRGVHHSRLVSSKFNYSWPSFRWARSVSLQQLSSAKLMVQPSQTAFVASSTQSLVSVANDSSSSVASNLTRRAEFADEQISNYILHNNEEILQWIHEVSRGKRCVRAVLARIPAAAVGGGVPMETASSSSSSSSDLKPSPSLTKSVPFAIGSSNRAPETSAPNVDDVPNVIKSLLLTPGQDTATVANTLHSHIPLPVTGEKQAELRQIFTDNDRGRTVRKCVDLLARVLAGYNASFDSNALLLRTIEAVPMVESDIHRLWIGWILEANVKSRSTQESEENAGETKLAKDKTQTQLAWFHCSRGGTVGGGVGPSPGHVNETICLPSKEQGESNVLNSSNTWLPDNLTQRIISTEIYVNNAEIGTIHDPLVEWSDAFFDCLDQRWYISYNALIVEASPRAKTNDTDDSAHEKGMWYTVRGVIRADVDITMTDINQCDHGTMEEEHDDSPLVLTFVTSNNERRALEAQAAGRQAVLPEYSQYFLHRAGQPPDSRQEDDKQQHTIFVNFFGTHKCHKENSRCQFEPGHGMVRGGYICKCKDGYHSAVSHLGPTFKGVNMEDSFHDKLIGKNPSYDYMYYCKRCAPGCELCVDESPCLSTYNWAFRISLLTITVFCIIFTFIIALNIYRHRKLKVIKVASPVFLCLTLLGCVIMYLEAVAIFPVLDVWTCALTKWTRHFGFCITYSALLLKTWRVSLTYRVKSAHKIKLTDKQLLQWLFPILLVMAIYLGSWTISDAPQAVYIIDWNSLKFKQCDYNWWDHSLAIGEFIFLLWGIKVCYNVRNAESLFNEAKYIVWAIYNITLVNIIMILIHVFILPNSGPDIKYFFGFVRTQLSTTVTVILIFGPKFYRVIKGQGDLWDNQLRARGLAATFSFNGVGLAHEETTDLYQENEELKEEIQKLAAQLEIMKICQMEFKNRHLGKSREAK